MHVFRIPSWIHALFPQATWRLPGETPCVYLTFDDGPHQLITPWVLEELDKAGAKAHFFVVGNNAAQHPELCDHILKQGHGLGSHTHNHVNGWETPTLTYIQDIQAGHAAHPQMGPYFRPPHGRIKPKFLRWLSQNGFKLAMWDVLSGDYNSKLNPDRILTQLKRKTRNGSLVVFHDSFKAEAHLRVVLPPYLAWLNHQGYSCLPLPHDGH
jgi:peptidoglycan/xylan/chitin deacetylase (PgdA/CDA1 family)